MLPPNIHSDLDLKTTHSETVKGFIAQALAKTTKADPHLAEARRLAAELQQLSSINQVVTIPSIQAALVAASGISDKARGHLTPLDMQQSLTQVLGSIATSNPTGWKDELVYRFLLTRGDTLGGSMRNYVGALGGRQLTAAIVTSLNQKGIRHDITRSRTNSDKITALAWPNRLLVFDKKPSFSDNNIDAILLDTSSATPGQKIVLGPSAAYVACGELKGGVDPGGADEHWKTANSAFQRIRTVFTGRVPHLFFVAGAIEASMAREIFTQLQNSDLEYAANLTVPQQLADLANWLVQL